MTSILENDYVPQDRPYSQKELAISRAKNFWNLRIGEIWAKHEKCRHYYRTRVNGRKEKEIKETNDSTIGNCSVCWKLSKTPRNLRQSANNMVCEYMERFWEPEERLYYDDIYLENVFYTWLYTE